LKNSPGSIDIRLCGTLIKGVTQREKISPLQREQASRLAGHRQSRRLPSASLCRKPAPLVENETLRRVSACKAVCAALREGEGSGATLRIKPLLTAVWSRIRPGNLTNELKFCPFDLWADKERCTQARPSRSQSPAMRGFSAIRQRCT